MSETFRRCLECGELHRPERLCARYEAADVEWLPGDEVRTADALAQLRAQPGYQWGRPMEAWFIRAIKLGIITERRRLGHKEK